MSNISITNASISYLLSLTLLILTELLMQALCGVLVDIPTLTGEKIPLNLANEVIKPTTVKKITGYGLPLPKEPTKRGDILVSFDIQFPDRMSQNTKDLLHDLLPNK